MIWHDLRGIFSFWRSGWVVSINAIEHIHIKWTFSWGELWDFWLLINLDLFFVSKQVCLTKSKQVPESTHHPAWHVLNSNLALGLWHHEGTWTEYWERVGKSGVTQGTEQASGIHRSPCLPSADPRGVGWGWEDRHQLAIRWLQFQAWLRSWLVVWSRPAIYHAASFHPS